MVLVILVVGSYLVGSIPFAYLVGRATRDIDIRYYGSGSLGTSNVWQNVGKWASFPSAAFDVFVKGSLPVYLAGVVTDNSWGIVACGIAAVVGHNWSIYVRFSGGRGIAVAFGLLIVLAWQVAVASVLVTVIGWVIFRSSAVWVGIGILALPLWSGYFSQGFHVIILSVGIVVIVALKRIMSNSTIGSPKISNRAIVIRRLIHDRDVDSRDEWVTRTPE
jgi:glycerol-3-phosphate acyltransferase PlsY